MLLVPRAAMGGLPILVVVLAAPLRAQDPAYPTLLEALRQAGLQAPLTLLPVRVLDRPMPDAAMALGLILERHGMADLEVAEHAFDPPAETGFAQLPGLLAAHVQAAAQPGAASRYHLYAEFLGTPKTGPKEVRFVIVDGAGQLVLSDRQTPADAIFQRTAARDPDPLGCATLVAERLFELAGWRKAPGSIRAGKFAERWRVKSGAPDKAERAAMQGRLRELRDHLGDARLVVAPTLALGKSDAASAQRLAHLTAEALGCSVTALPDGPQLVVPPSSNEQKRLWDLVRGLRTALGEQPSIDADYVLVADLGVHPDDKSGFVHSVLCTRTGEVVFADFLNDQHPMYRKHAPKTIEDAERLVVARVSQLLR